MTVNEFRAEVSRLAKVAAVRYVLLCRLDDGKTGIDHGLTPESLVALLRQAADEYEKGRYRESVPPDPPAVESLISDLGAIARRKGQ